jgi:hypothetical protein
MAFSAIAAVSNNHAWGGDGLGIMGVLRGFELQLKRQPVDRHAVFGVADEYWFLFLAHGVSPVLEMSGFPNAARGRRGICETHCSPESAGAPSDSLLAQRWGVSVCQRTCFQSVPSWGWEVTVADPWLSGGFTSRVEGRLRPWLRGVLRCDGLTLRAVIIIVNTQSNKYFWRRNKMSPRSWLAESQA